MRDGFSRLIHRRLYLRLGFLALSYEDGFGAFNNDEGTYLSKRLRLCATVFFPKCVVERNQRIGLCGAGALTSPATCLSVSRTTKLSTKTAIARSSF